MFDSIKNLLEHTVDGKKAYYSRYVTTTEPLFQIELNTEQDTLSISCYQHCINIEPYQESSPEKIEFTDKQLPLGTEQYDLTPYRKYVKTNLAEMKVNYFYQTLKNVPTTLATNKFIHSRLSDEISMIQSTNPNTE